MKICVLGLAEWHQNFGWKVTQWLNSLECMVEWEMKALMNCFIFCMSLYTSLYGAMIVSTLCLNIRHQSMKWQTSKIWLTKLFASWRAFFTSLVVKSAEASPWHVRTVLILCFTEHCQWFKFILSSLGTMTVKNFPTISLLKISKNSSPGTWWDNVTVFRISSCWLGGPRTASRQSCFQHPLTTSEDNRSLVKIQHVFSPST